MHDNTVLLGAGAGPGISGLGNEGIIIGGKKKDS